LAITDAIVGVGRSGRRVTRVVLASAALLAVASAAAPAGAAVPRSFYGTVRFAPLIASDFNRLGKARVGTLRYQISWPEVQPTRNGPYTFGAIDADVASAAEQGITIFATLAGFPPYVHRSCGGDTGCERHIYLSTAGQRNGWKAFAAAVARRYGPRGAFWRHHPRIPYHPIRHWQVWNEQNFPVQYTPPKRYAKLLKLTDRAISAVDRKAKIVLGGMFGGRRLARVGNKYTAWRYLSHLYKNHARRHFDAVALHAYSHSQILDTITYEVEKLRGAMKAHHDKKTPLFVTEIGWGSRKKKPRGPLNVGARKQAKNLTRSFKLLTSHRKRWRIGGVYWFTWKDPLNRPPGLCRFCYSSGLYKADGKTAKPALSAYERFTRKTRG
jgi:hypothetical protein